jgi:nicotinamidase-related amidase
MKPEAMIVIDVQTALVEAHPYHEETLIGNIQKLLAACRRAGVPVVYVQHSDEELVHGTPDWEIAAAIAPEAGERVFEKHFNSAFRGTGLHEYLQSLGAKNLLICGMQTEYCVDTSVKVAFELGYTVTVPGDGTSTFDNKLFKAADLVTFYQYYIWNGAFAEVTPMETLLEAIG